MTKLFYIMGKSATGKDTIYKKIKEKIEINSYVSYTTRPIRSGEKDGIDYNFISFDEVSKYENENNVIESRTYQTVHGPWIYLTINDEQLSQEGNILTVGTLESYEKIIDYFKDNKEVKVFPIYICVDEDERRKRAIAREEKQANPKFEEMERRLKADNIDFSDENIKRVGITSEETFFNYNIDECVNEIIKYITKEY